MSTPKAPYTIRRKETVAQTNGLQVSEMTLGPGDEVPWHSHSTITDTTYCLHGEIEVSFLGGGGPVRLAPGESVRVEPERIHRVRNVGAGEARFLLVQGIGSYDFVPADTKVRADKNEKRDEETTR